MHAHSILSFLQFYSFWFPYSSLLLSLFFFHHLRHSATHTQPIGIVAFVNNLINIFNIFNLGRELHMNFMHVIIIIKGYLYFESSNFTIISLRNKQQQQRQQQSGLQSTNLNFNCKYSINGPM